MNEIIHHYKILIILDLSKKLRMVKSCCMLAHCEVVYF